MGIGLEIGVVRKSNAVVSRIQTSRGFLMMTDARNEKPRHGKATTYLLNQPGSQP